MADASRIEAPTLTDALSRSRFRALAVCLGLVLLIALVARLTFAALVVAQHDSATFTDLHGDTSSYLRIGERLYDGLSYTAGGGALRLRGLVRPPGYPAFYAAVRAAYRCIGVDLNADLRPIVWPQAALSLIHVAMTYLLAWFTLRNIIVATAAGLIAALSPTGIGTSAIAMPDSLFAAMFSVAFVGFVLAMQNRSRWQFGIVGGIALAFAALLKPAAIYWPILVVPALLLARGFTRETLFEGFRLLTPMIVVVAAWTTRNYVSQGVPAFSIVSANNMRYEVAAKVEAAARLGRMPTQAEFMKYAARAGQDNYDYIRQDNASTAVVYQRITNETHDILRAHPTLTARVLASNLKSELLWRYKLTKRQLPNGRNAIAQFYRSTFDLTDSPLAVCAWYLPLLLAVPVCWRDRSSRLPLMLCWIGLIYIALPTASVANEGSRLLLASEPMAATLVVAGVYGVIAPTRRFIFSGESRNGSDTR